MSKVMRFYNPKTNQYEPINAGGVLDENTGKVLTGSDIDKKADKDYVDDKISNIDINQFEAIDKGINRYSFNNLKEPGVYRLWDSTTGPSGTTDDYITVVFRHNNKITQVAHSSTTASGEENRVYTRYYTGNHWTSWREITNVEIEEELKTKANKEHTHSATDVRETSSRNFVTSSQLSDINKISDKADKSYVDDKISNIDINQFDAINKGGYSFNNLKEPGVYRLWNSSTSPCGTTDDYITVVFKYNDKITQVAHSSTTTSSRENRVYTRYYTGSRWTSWRELTNVEVEKEIDSLKQSGVESNRILVDALNSKGVWASTSSTIKTNVNKVKDIKVGDYSVGDIIDITKLKPVWGDRNPTALWEYSVGSNVNGVAVDNSGYVYSGSNDGRVMKISPHGNKVWEFTGHISNVYSVAVDKDGYVYSGSSDKKVIKISPSGNKVWEFTGHGNTVWAVAVDNSGYVYSGGNDRRVMKISPSGSKVWERLVGYVYSVAVDKDGYVYSVYSNKVRKISPSGSKVWEYSVGSSVEAVAVDKDGYVYSGSNDGRVMKISPQGNKVWEFTGHTRMVNAVAVDSNGYVYSGSNDKKVMKISPHGNKVWEFTGHGDFVRAVAVDNSGYVYSGGRDSKVIKISPGNLSGYKIIA